MFGQLHVRYRAASIEESQSGNLSFGMIISAVRVTYRVHTPSNISSQCDLKSPQCTHLPVSVSYRVHTPSNISSQCDLKCAHTFQYSAVSVTYRVHTPVSVTYRVNTPSNTAEVTGQRVNLRIRLIMSRISLEISRMFSLCRTRQDTRKQIV